MKVLIAALATVSLSVATWSTMLPGQPVNDYELSSIAGLQCGLTGSTTGQPNCAGGGSWCGFIPCFFGACGPNAVGAVCSSPGQPCPGCTGGQDIKCLATGQSNDYCSMYFGPCCTLTSVCTTHFVEDPSIGGRRFSCSCSPGGATTFLNRTLSEVLFNDPRCLPTTGGLPPGEL
jgi:hypothetical protein